MIKTEKKVVMTRVCVNIFFVHVWILTREWLPDVKTCVILLPLREIKKKKSPGVTKEITAQMNLPKPLTLSPHITIFFLPIHSQYVFFCNSTHRLFKT